MRTLITNGTIVTADGSTAADVLIDGETVAQVGRDLAASVTADETIDATGKYVIPGGIDVHTHMELPFGGTFAKDTFETGTRAAAFGGTTSIVDGPLDGSTVILGQSSNSTFSGFTFVPVGMPGNPTVYALAQTPQMTGG
jgi:dihydroorotase-like cyclic amidohydrolase